jgi:hypothetical protein
MGLAEPTCGFLAFAHAIGRSGWLSLNRHDHVPEEPTEQAQADERLGRDVTAAHATQAASA